MGLSLNQALNTASMGMSAAESNINVIGNNLSNANTTGFKANRADFADIFYRTYSYGSAPYATNAGANPEQIGLGVRLTGVTTDFSQGTIKDGMTSTDMAIQGDGFFILQPDPNNPNLRYFTRDGVMKRNAAGELVSSNGQYVMGYTINDKFQLQTDKLSKLSIPLGEMKIAEATEHVVLDGLLNATGDNATQGTVIVSDMLSDLSKSSPGFESLAVSTVSKPNVELLSTTATGQTGTGSLDTGDYIYRFVFVDAAGNESDYSAPIHAAVQEGENSVLLTGLPPANDAYTTLRIYRADAPENPTDPGVFYKLADLSLAGNPTEYTDTTAREAIVDEKNELDQARLSGRYTYYVTYFDANGNESRPSALSSPITTSGGKVELSDIPAVGSENPDGWIGRNIYRCTADNSEEFFKVTTIADMNPGTKFIDSLPDSTLKLNTPLSKAGLGNVLANESTKLVNLGKMQDDGTFQPQFQVGTLEFTPNKGGANLKTQSLQITEQTTVAEYLRFLEQSLGLRTGNSDSIPPDQGAFGQLINDGKPGAEIKNGSIFILGNSGTKNAIDVDAGDFKLRTTSGVKAVGIDYGAIQQATGESLSMTMEVYDSLGTPVNVKMTLVLQEKTDTETIYRWYADSNDNQPLVGNEIGLGTGLIRFDSHGKYIDATNTNITVQRTDLASKSPMNFSFDMALSSVAALSTTKPDMTMKSQDGAGAGILIDFTIGTDGVIHGIFSSNVVRPLGQVLLATFINDEGLVRQGDNLFREGLASGHAKIGVPGTGTAGVIRGNSIELSNTNIGRELIDMILASTMYQANAKIITTTNVMMDALLRAVG
ncbi:MAG: flagellar hook-basal body complex protein [Planctomycetaceae bacterium]|nr:flagellar hook-basal body complex protein [Planctomycetaceae bacterium]